MKRVPVVVAAGLCGALLAASPAAAEDEATAVTITPAALSTLDEGELSVAPVGTAQVIGPAQFSLPVAGVALSGTGKVRRLRLDGGLRLTSDPAAVELTNLRVNLPARRVTVKASSADTRVGAFELANVKVTKRRVKGVLLIAPGAAAVLNEQFDTYVFSDGLRFARITYPLS